MSADPDAPHADHLREATLRMLEWTGRIEVMATGARDLFRRLGHGDTLTPREAAVYATGFDQLWRDVAATRDLLERCTQTRRVM